ncbi:MAG: TIGR01777 family oxidoreductase [Chlorobi bacterium]|nr:TIGR01777 family oxidoreductase [Chlorobiota bacterium]
MTTILVAGATGFLGRATIAHLSSRGYRTIALVRDLERAHRVLGRDVESITWDDVERAVSSADAVVNFSGENIAAARWSAPRKAVLYSSRIEPTRRLVQAIGTAATKPRVLLNASAVGYYGSRDDEILTENSPKGNGFLADLCAVWENAARQAESYCRVVRLRFGVVIGRDGGMLARLEPIVKTVGAVVPGSGRQWQSWVALADAVSAIAWLLNRDSIAGAVNITAPQPVTIEELIRTLARIHHRPVWFHIPEQVLRLALGQMAQTLTDSTRVLPARLLEAGFHFEHAVVESALLV